MKKIISLVMLLVLGLSVVVMAEDLPPPPPFPPPVEPIEEPILVLECPIFGVEESDYEITFYYKSKEYTLENVNIEVSGNKISVEIEKKSVLRNIIRKLKKLLR